MSERKNRNENKDNHSEGIRSQNAVIDLTQATAAGSRLDEYTAEYRKEASQSFTKSAKRQRSGWLPSFSSTRGATTTKKKPPKDVDAIDVDGEHNQTAMTTSLSNADETKNKPDYRQILGPLRMAFVDSFATAHNAKYFALFRQKQANTGTTNLQLLYKELVEYQLNLPVDQEGAIYCRALESNLQCLRVLITGPKESPYATGCFLFDVELDDYPNRPPKVKFLTTGDGKVRFNPNLYQDGKVCLSLLGTWQGPGWLPGKSTLLQVLVSIQGLIMVNEPYFNEPGWEKHRGTAQGAKESKKYNCNLYGHTLRHGVLEMLHHGQERYPEFYPIIQRHFAYHKDFLLEKMQEWQKESPKTVSPLIPEVHTALACLPPLVSRKRAVAAKPSAPETISLEDDNDDGDTVLSGKATDKKSPETIVLD